MFDIYGDKLEYGFCEAHPWVRESYPCSLCLFAKQKEKEAKLAEEEYWKEYGKHLEKEYLEYVISEQQGTCGDGI